MPVARYKTLEEDEADLPPSPDPETGIRTAIALSRMDEATRRGIRISQRASAATARSGKEKPTASATLLSNSGEPTVGEEPQPGTTGGLALVLGIGTLFP